MGAVRQTEAVGSTQLPRIAFAIALEPRSAYSDWELVEADLRRTIGSIRSAWGGEDAAVVVACHEPPDLGALAAGVELLCVPFPPPSDEPLERGRDKTRKLRLAAARLRDRVGGGDVYLICLDPGSLIHWDLLTYVLQNGQQSYVAEHGYLFDGASSSLWRYRTGFDLVCETPVISAFRAQELPESWDDESSTFGSADAEPRSTSAPLPFAAVVCVDKATENGSGGRAGGRDDEAAVADLIRPRYARTILQEEFGAPDLAAAAASGEPTPLSQRAPLRQAEDVVARQSAPGAPDAASAGTERVRRLISTSKVGTELDAGGLREKVRSGLGWKFATFVFGQGTQSLVAILLAHLLVPRDFGLAGMALAFSGIAAAFSDLGLGRALIQQKTLSEQDISTVFWINAGAGAGLTLVGVAVSPLVAAFFSNSRVIPLFVALSCSYFISGLGQTQAALLNREMSFRSLELRTIASTLVGAAAGVAFAVAGFGPWAIISQVLFTSGASTLMLWTVSPWRPRFTFSRDSFRTLGSFGLKTLMIRLLAWVNLNGDNLLIGRYIGSVALGIYAVAYNVMLLPMARLTAPVMDVLYSAFVRLQHEPRRMGEAWLRINSLTASLIVPAFLGLIVLAPDFVPVVLGRKWDAAIPVLQFLSIGGVAQNLQAYNGQLYQALGIPGLFVRFMCFSTAVTFSAFVVGLHWGVVGVAASFAAARTIVLIVNMVQMARLVEMRVWRILRSYLAIISRAGAMAAIVYAGRLGLTHEGVPISLRLVFLSLGGAFFYFGLTALAAPQLVRDFRRGIRGRVAATA